MKTVHAVLAAAPLAFGCQDAAPPDEPSPSTGRTITARDATTLRSADGSTVAFATDLDAAVVQLYARDASGAWTAHAGEGTSTGELRVAGATADPGWLRVDYFDASPEPRPRNELFWIDGSSDDVALDLGTWRTGRTGTKIATAVPTELRLQLTGLAPWRSERDRMVVVAPNVGFAQVFTQNLDGISGMPADTDTSATLSVDWAGALAAPLLDADRGDHAYAMQFRFLYRDPMWIGTSIKAAALSAVTQTNGMLSTTNAALTDASNVSVRVAMDRDAFDALRPSIGREVSPALGRGFAISASATPITEEMSRTSLPIELVVLEGDAITDGGLLDLGDVSVASPLPASSTYGQFISAYAVTVERDDGLVAHTQAQVGVITQSLPTEAAPAAPIVGPVRNVTIGGKPAFSAPKGVGITPQIAWEPPALGTPVEYEVRILAPGGADPTYDFVWYPSAIFHVPGNQTSLALPPEILEPGLPYAIAIRAISQPIGRDQLATSPRKVALPYGWADAITPAFKP